MISEKVVLHTGIIIYCDHTRGFGFIKANDNKSVHFRYLDFGQWSSDGDSPLPESLPQSPTSYVSHGLKVEYIPGKPTDKGDRARFVAVAGTYKKAEQKCLERPKIRFRQRNGRKRLSRLQESPKLTTLWEGKSIRLLSDFWPKNVFNVCDHDFLGRYFEKYDEINQTWIPIDDPRKPLPFSTTIMSH